MQVKNWFSVVRNVVLLALAVYCAVLGWEAFSIPGKLPVEKQTEKFRERLAQIVDEQWSRPESVPTDADCAAFETLISDMSRVNYSDITQEYKRVCELEAKAYSVNLSRAQRVRRRHAWLQTKIGKFGQCGEAGTLGELVAFGIAQLDPAACTADYRWMKLRSRSSQLGNQIGIKADAYYHYAMALVLAGKKDAAIRQLIAVMQDDSVDDYVLSNDMYMIAGRLNAIDNPSFLSEFAKVGGDIDCLRNDYTGPGQEVTLFPTVIPRNKRLYHYPLR